MTPQHKVHIPYWLLSLCALVVLLLMATLATRLKEDKKTTSSTSASTNRLTDQPENPNTYFEQIGKTATEEAFVVKNWNILGADVPTATTSGRVYPLLSDLSQAQVEPIMHRIVGRDIALQSESGAYIASDAAALIKLDADTGWFTLQSPGGMPLPSVAGIESAVLAYVEQVFNEQTFMIKSYFTRRGEPDVRYYEVQRDWNKLGLPVVNLQELLPYSAKLSLAQWTQTPLPSWVQIIPSDESIVYASDVTTGRARIGEVNTVIVGVKEGKIVSVDSHMHLRDLSQSEQTDELVPALEALTKVTRGQYDMFVAQQDSADEKGKPIALSSGVLMNARVLQARLMYISTGSGQAQQALIPTYVFQGVATSERGHTVQFMATFPAPVHSSGNGVTVTTKKGD